MRASFMAIALACSVMSACSYQRTDPMGSGDAMGSDGATVDGAAVDGAAPDAAPVDAPGPGLTAATIPLRIAIGDTVGLTLLISGPPSATVMWSLTSGGGTFQPASGTVATTAAGTGVIALDYTAPASAGDRAHLLHLMAGITSDAPFDTPVRALIAAGENTPFADNAGIAVNADFLYGQQIFIPRDVVVMRLGLFVQLGGYNGRMALYSNVAGAPRVLVVGSALTTITAGPNEIRVTPTMVSMGTYWLMGNFTGTAPIKRDAVVINGQAFVTLATGEALPASLDAVTTANNRVLNYYLLFAD